MLTNYDVGTTELYYNCLHEHQGVGALQKQISMMDVDLKVKDIFADKLFKRVQLNFTSTVAYVSIRVYGQFKNKTGRNVVDLKVKNTN